MPTFSLQELAFIAKGTIVGDSGSNITVSAIAFSSRDVKPGCLFVAVRGATQDGHKWIDDAFTRGAVAAVVEDADRLNGRAGILVSNARCSLSALADHFAGNPVSDLKLVGVTGTNGKTTTNWLVCHTLTALGCPCARIGTLGMVFECIDRESLTTPDPISLHSFLREAVNVGAKSAVLEVSSHGLDQERAANVPFDVGIFTNLTRDHLDYHETVERYRAAKMKLFELVRNNNRPVKGIVVNLDSECGLSVREEVLSPPLIDYSFGSQPDAPIRIINFDERGIESRLELQYLGQRYEVRVKMVGRHNAENLTSAFCACVALGWSPEEVAKALGRVPQVPGRLERVDENGPRVFVDYAHTPDALERAITALRPSTVGKVWVVFGCGGDRDRGKRPLMAEVARRLSDLMVVTSDNPRTESAEAIIQDILAGGAHADFVHVDRRLAIREAIIKADLSDTVLIAGKGHEDYQIIGTTKNHFSDQEEAREALGLRTGLSSNPAGS